jgi:hypothetical protein
VSPTSRSRIARALAAIALALVALFAAPPAARADSPTPAPPDGSWGAQLQSVAAWLAQRNGTSACTTHCFVLTRLHLTGPADGAMKFSLEGAVLAPEPFAVPLFGPPGHARIENVTMNGKPAAVGFEGDHWFAVTPPGRFVVDGTIALDGDLALVIPGPLDALDAELSRGRLVEGARLSGLTGATVHFDHDATASPAAEPPVFQLSRAVRVAREVTFEYRLVMRSGQDLGVVRVPLKYGEKVLDVQGSSGWTVDAGDLVLPTAGHSASMVITGTLASLGHFEPDTRSSYEWWLIEADAEHRLQVDGDARQVEASESPIARSQPSGRLFLVGRGQHVDVKAETLVATEVLAAVVRSHDRTLVLTPNGDLVADDTLSYENDGIDWLAWPPNGTAVYLATDGKAERVMRTSDGARDVLVPLRVGSHNVHLQSMATASVGALGGWLSIPTPTHALTTSRTTATIGLPSSVHPLAVLGGDRPWFVANLEDALALGASLVIAIIALRGRTRRVLGAASLAGLWVAWPTAWVGLVAVGVLAAVAWLLSRLLTGNLRIAAWAVLGTVAFVAGLVATANRPSHSFGAVSGESVNVPVASPSVPQADDLEQKNALKKEESRKPDRGAAQGYWASDSTVALGEDNGRKALGGVVQGVAPVALTLPQYERSVAVSRELVTRERPFNPVVVYVTTLGLAPLVVAWLLCISVLGLLCRADIGRFVRAVRARLARKPESPATAPTPAAPPPIAA